MPIGGGMQRLSSAAALSCLLCVAATSCGAPTPLLPKPARLPALEAIRRARDQGATESAHALYQLALANQEMQEADALIHAGNMTEAAVHLARAEEDANVAAALARGSAPVDGGVR